MKDKIPTSPKEKKVVEIKGKFTDGEGKPAAGACFRLTLGHDDPDAEFKVFEDGEEVDYSGDIFVLGSGGELPSGACVWGTDEIHPAGSHYSIEVGKIVGMHSRHYYSSKGRVEITGRRYPSLSPRQSSSSPRGRCLHHASSEQIIAGFMQA